MSQHHHPQTIFFENYVQPKRLSDLLSDFIAQYLGALDAGVCTEHQCGIAVRSKSGENIFFAVNRNPAIECNPRKLVPEHMSELVAHAVFTCEAGAYRFTTDTNNGKVAASNMVIENPIVIRLTPENGTPQLWLMSLDSQPAEDDDNLFQAFRANEATLSRVSSTQYATSRHH